MVIEEPMTEIESDSIEGIARSALTDRGRGNYDLETLDAIIEENLWQAARDGLDDDAVADLLLRHRDGVVCNGLADHAGLNREVATDGGVSRRKFLGTAAAATAGVSIASGEGSAESTDEVHESPDLSNDYPNTRRMKGGTGHALTGIYAPDTWSRSTRAESEDFGGVTELGFYQHALQWGMRISLKIRKGDVETSIPIDVDRAELLGHWLIEAARDTKQWRAENPEAWNYEMDTSDNVADRINEPAVGEGELGTDRLKTPAQLAVALSEVADADQ